MNKIKENVIGIVGGMGPQAGIDLFSYILAHTPARTDQEHLPVIMLSFPGQLGDRTAFLEGVVPGNPAYNIAEFIGKLEEAGASIIGIACNTSHVPEIFDVIKEQLVIRNSKVRLLNMPVETCRHIQECHPEVRRVGMMTTNGTYHSGLYQELLRSFGYEAIIPDPAFQQDVIHRMIYDPVFGLKANPNRIRSQARKLMEESTRFFRDHKAEVIILGCTDLSPMVREMPATDILFVDSTEALALALIRQVTKTSNHKHMDKFSGFHLAENAKILSDTIPGEKSRELLATQEALEGSIVSYPKSMPIAIKRAKGAIIEDVDGNQFIDFFSGAGVLNVGHCNAYVQRYVSEQQEKLIHALDFPTENKMDLIKKILNRIPPAIRDQFKVSFCGPTGSDAVEAAIKLAKHKTGREGVIAFHGSYHGMTSGALSATSNVKLRARISSLVPNITFIPYSYCYRCPFNKEAQTCRLDCAEYLRYILENPHSGIGKPAAIILEPIQGEGGTIVPKAGFLERIVDIARSNDIVVIFDEIQCGFFRTGDFWGFQHTNAFPDIITMSKGLGGIGFPISAIIYNKAIESWGPGDHIGTFRGNQVSIAAGNGAFDFISDYEVAQHVGEMGQYLMARLNALKRDSPYIGEVRGKGLIIGIEYVKSLESKTPDPVIVKKIRNICFANGLLFETGGHYNNVIRFIPPLIITRQIIDNALAIFEKANKEVEAAALRLLPVNR